MQSAKIDIRDAVPEMLLAESVYITGSNNSQMLLARKGTVLNDGIINMLARRNVSTIEVIKRKRLESKFKPVMHVPVKIIVNEELKKEAVTSVKQLFDCVVEPEASINRTTAYHYVSDIEGVVGELLDVVTHDPMGLVHINNLKQFDEYTYHHSLSVAVLSIATGHELGLDRKTLLRLGRCAILHDIGKQLIPRDIICKKSKITKEEYQRIQYHPKLGANHLIKNAVGDDELWYSIICHHERVDGTGYPNGLKGDEIPLFSRIIAVADVYDAITSYRSYRSPMQPLEAFKVIYNEIGKAFDYNIVKAFYTRLEFFPINSPVELSDGRIAIVVKGGGALKLRPSVKLWGSDDVLNLSDYENHDISVTRLLNPATLPLGYEYAYS